MSNKELEFKEELANLSKNQLQELFRSRKRNLSTINSESSELRMERKNNVHIVKTLRAAFGKSLSSNKERVELLKQFRKKRDEIRTLKQKRDEINACVPPPSEILFEWLANTYSKLTTIDNDLTGIDMLNRELGSFSRFFELQASIKKKRISEENHKSYVEKINEIKLISEKLDNQKEVSENKVSEIVQDLDIEENSVNRKEINQISNRISKIDKNLEKLDKQRKEEKRNLKIISEFRNKINNNSRILEISDLKSLASSGGSLSTYEMDAILDSGGLSKLSIEDNKKNFSIPTNNRKNKKKKRKLGVSRVGGRKGSLASKRDD